MWVECHSSCSPEGLSAAKETDEEAKNDRRACKGLGLCQIDRKGTYYLCLGKVESWIISQVGDAQIG